MAYKPRFSSATLHIHPPSHSSLLTTLTWAPFRSLFASSFPREIPSNFAEWFNSLAIRTSEIPFASIFDSQFPSLILDSVHRLFECRARDRDLAPFIWSLSMMGKAPTPFLRFFLETDAIPTLGAIATSGYVTSSPHAFRALINLADNQEISVLLCEQTERFIEFYVGCSARERDFPAGRLCLELLATLAIVSPSYERIAFFLLDVGLPSAIAILAQSREGVEMIAAHSDFCANLPQALRDVERQAVTDTLAIILALVRHSRIADSLLDRPMLFALGTVINCCNEGQAVLAFEILTIVAQHQIGIDMIIQCTNILPMAIAFATNRPYSARIAASNFLASLFVFSTQEVVDRLLICGAADCFVDLIGDFTASAMLFEAIELIIGRGGAKKRLLEALAAVASESEHPRSDIAQSLLALSPTGDRLKWQTR